MGQHADNNEYLYHVGVPTGISSFYPVTLACWVRKPNTSGVQYVLSYGGEVSGTQRAANSIRLNEANIEAFSFHSVVNDKATSTQALIANTWMQVTAVFAAANDRRVYVNGGDKGTNSTPLTDFGATYLERTRICSSASDQEKDIQDLIGDVAEVGIWYAALNDAEALELATKCPLDVRPDDLKLYLDQETLSFVDQIIPWTFTEIGGSISLTDHPTIICGGGEIFGPKIQVV